MQKFFTASPPQPFAIFGEIDFHTARHTFATLLLTKGADIYTTSKLLGHNDIATTQVYARVVDEKKQKALSLINGLIGGGKE
ncbi:MAG: tyrosine-type recombinase/integrase [Bacteroidales bacterium]|nr:tyrosine-type recombinase/integrase [Bacteroidales bacterium]